MSKNINQVFIANPITVNVSTDLMYFGQSPYGVNNDAAMTFSNFQAQFSTATYSTHNAVLTTNATGVVTPIALVDGQVIVGSTIGAPLAATLTNGSGISITNGHNSITIATNGSQPWVDQTTSSVTMSANTGYTADAGASLITFTLPATSAIGDWVEINGKGSGLFRVAQAAGQQIHFGNQTTTSGAGGSITSTLQYDVIKLRCLTANTIWTIVYCVGNPTVV